MKTSSFTALLCLLFTTLTSADPVSVSFDQIYDDRTGSMTTVSCSDGPNGLITRFGFQRFSDVPTFPNIGGAGVIPGFNSPNCGTCWALSFNGTTVNVLALDHAATGTFNIALTAMNTLTNGNAIQLGRITANANQVAASACGL
ncbi:hypothetical protein PC9H_001541 [Pleurotus ostreatus]|uniref:Uncharacterized protein n=2 Tax=Pleurotus ostreatus TaxID=5322 RepID=A0A067PDS5_PLEO1|nr:uncharacterized protein PC9H_001541 [Pleurotus ostreatus]KAF7441192.1 hypothetical protein PC9H_001541 [Pleurotus ostreatus]KAJ8699302.1 hypothetical protein PTI98_002429 [Pleurotus ostreatus]KDQ34041.1 hypothetical protein PLEOSDRAFT_1081025 [Pleurotus ostreatus PC15]